MNTYTVFDGRGGERIVTAASVKEDVSGRVKFYDESGGIVASFVGHGGWFKNEVNQDV